MFPSNLVVVVTGAVVTRDCLMRHANFRWRPGRVSLICAATARDLTLFSTRSEPRLRVGISEDRGLSSELNSRAEPSEGVHSR